ncbi:hypothetical protein U8P73_36260 (plasmid) [Rhizobium beringeri]|uniref:hypothetical protein n=1 Tax=Rhizobium beringeri TaxID=3019934 RepID=UPI002DDD7924|nr:hypothetical protein [Rhizobium beringeri]WSG93605.1 hypothetical protein U8P73_36260 [Rhizobium beringeri]
MATTVIYIDPTAGNDSNTGTKPSQAIKTWAARTSKGSGTKTYPIRRGTVLDAAMVLANNETVRRYGDPTLPAPKVSTTSAFGLSGTDLAGATVQDVDISAGQRAININRGTNFKAFRCGVPRADRWHQPPALLHHPGHGPGAPAQLGAGQLLWR